MSELEPQPDRAEPDVIPEKTTPTWEMEMLLSGATVFGLLQLPDAFNGMVEPLLARLGGNIAAVANMLAMYAGAAIYVLLITFIMHLTVRGFWIALLGLRSVFPDGPDFERLRGGPIARDLARQQTPRVDVEIERLDNLATTIFLFGAMAVAGVLMAGSIGVPLMVLVWLWPDASIGRLILVTLGVALGPMLLASTFDALIGHRLDRTGWFARWIAGVLTYYQRTSAPRFLNVIITTLMTRFGFGRFMVAYVAVLCVVMVGYVVHQDIRRSGKAIGDYGSIPAPAASGFAVLPQFYRDQRRGDERLSRTPFLDSMQVNGDWLRLIVPFHPTRHKAAIATHCPTVWATLPLPEAADATAADPRARALLACYRDLAAIRIDDQAVATLPDVVVLPDSRLRGLLFMIDARSLAPGRHVLQTAALPHPRDDDAGKLPAPYRIPFWK